MNDGTNEANQSTTAAVAGAKAEAQDAAGAAKSDGTLQGLKDKGGKVLKALKTTNPAKGSKAPKSGKSAKAPKPAKGTKTGKATKGAKTAKAAKTAKDAKGSKAKTGKPITTTDGCPFRPTASYGKLWMLLHKHREKGISRADFIKEGAKVIGKDLKHTAYDVAVVASPTKDGKAHPSANRAADHYWVERSDGGMLKLHLR